MTTPLVIQQDVSGNRVNLSDCSRKFSDTAQIFTLTAGAATTVTVPAVSGPPGATNNLNNLLMLAAFTPNKTVLVQPSAAPALVAPTGVVTATTAEVNPYGFRAVIPGQQLQFFTSDAGVTVGITYYLYNP